MWVYKYDLIGLVSYYEATGYEPALAALLEDRRPAVPQVWSGLG